MTTRPHIDVIGLRHISLTTITKLAPTKMAGAQG